MESGILIGLIKIIFINIVLSGDNAVVIALACRNLAKEQQQKAIFYGSFGAIVLRVALTFIAVWMLHIPLVQAAGGLLLVYIAVKLLKNGEGEEKINSSPRIDEAIKTIIIADLVMSLDNVLAVAGAADGNYFLIGFGLLISIPLIIWGSQLLMRLMNRFPVIVLLGAGLLGFTAGEMIIGDRLVSQVAEAVFPQIRYILPAGSVLLIIVLGIVNKRREVRTEKAGSSM
ncbi:TerC family protein [Paenibacillus piri]|uniref:TerC family protein n=1 Tax=Paenibacillus piri TaxID=2547395 RepID=A0A4R5KHI2_9BACL|nr:TerC family protein [Paenibacillus piri]TDF94796.1 TerC family protein [Paenibacillus piri]